MTPQRLEQLRSIPLPEILQACGAKPVHYDRHKWETSVGVISVTGPKFMNWNLGRGGGGAIDLVIHLQQFSFKEALLWLSNRFPNPRSEEKLASSKINPPSPGSAELLLPHPNTAKLHLVKDYLVKTRTIPAAVVESLIQSGTLYADSMPNAVFLLLGNKNLPVGAELRGTSIHKWRGLAPGSRKDLGYFSISNDNPKFVVLCESAIDAISCFVLHPNYRCISTAGARANPLWLTSLIRQGYVIYCGFDADPVGDYHAQNMICLYPQILRFRPTAHDWNDVLKAKS